MKGKVWLVGAGPGDPTLLTVKALYCIREADVIVYDRLVSKEILQQAPSSCQMVNVGKLPNFHPIPQDDINETLVNFAQQGYNVVRLKGGDPYVFGRGGEEADALVEHGIEFEVVPGISSAIGGLAYAGIPVTHRDHASSFHVVTGHLKQGKDPLDWSLYSKLDGTLVILMGMSQIENICQQLVDSGKATDTPAAVVRYASRDNQQVVTGTVTDIAQRVKEEGITSPALIVIGGVAQKHATLSFKATCRQISELAQLQLDLA
ncbi:uroporphyrinogen-III C-methyltransferase [Vibrio plantisponsor]|uniref:uroporphyrinogen-III C-methyltransferase n=1 Tax=Vibrio plantisponsor TaxID=664643 RepID=A0ABU4IIM5_9VIBR|nr:uroporphyrinogen-III C-methyltransferase [Vibrio plantisponsor]MDW6017114.1 uroporphyrinogen-III C-methyltransferase [Vibrio plantisponsor]NNM40881.1 uroporphyrinogen-III C-methyltransferase [Vibrio plantisponsor]